MTFRKRLALQYSFCLFDFLKVTFRVLGSLSIVQNKQPSFSSNTSRDFSFFHLLLFHSFKDFKRGSKMDRFRENCTSESKITFLEIITGAVAWIIMASLPYTKMIYTGGYTIPFHIVLARM